MKKPLCSTGLRWLWLAVLVLVLDAISKQLILANYGLHESTSLIPYFNLTYVRNYG
ncbi:lipoprotein signal peptidase, partial [Klebsiella pneumoniae]|nr:lipoprotein signal peptidase [Klebsiella pneumoniae]